MYSDIIDDLIKRRPEIGLCRSEILKTVGILLSSFKDGGKLLICGNGGSAADAMHIVGELMKNFDLKRKSDEKLRDKLSQFPDGDYLFDNLERALPAVDLVSSSALFTAYVNDVKADMVFAQQVYALGRGCDVLLCISTSGNSENVANAAKVAKVCGIKTVALTGRDGGMLKKLCDACIIAPGKSTYEIQECHLPIYHAICRALEAELFS